MRKPALARRIAKLLIITGYLTNWQDPILSFGPRQSEVHLFYYLMSYSVKELNELLDDLIHILDNSPILIDQKNKRDELKEARKM
ncbi:hypothetical protein [Enterococcus sp. AZ196]|uniref:hypothetical protein n=1 Tax=Enterococcus sp. AZ196 TaxID=2774659 RepID=UPI003D29BF67